MSMENSDVEENKLGFGKQKLIAEIIKQNWGVETPWDKKVFTYQDVLFIIQEMQHEEGKAYFDDNTAPRKGFYVFGDFARHLLYRNIANYDSMILLTSEKGTGKSSAAIMLAREWCKIIGIKFDPNRHIAYNNGDVMRKIDQLNKFEPIICDEAIRFASAADWNRKENKELKKKLAQVRTKHLLYILCFPLKIYKLEKTYLESYVNYWIDLFGRGVGAIYVKDRNPVQDSWRMKEFQKIGSYTEFTNISKVQEILKKHPNFWRIIKFPKPPRWLYDRYLMVREKNIYDDDNVLADVSSEDVHRALLVLSLRDIMMHDTTLSMNRIILHIKNEYDIPISKTNVSDILTDAKHLISKVREESMKL
jgi:hypothetical protein